MTADWPADAERLVDAATVARALDAQARRLESRLSADVPVTVLVLMNGGMYPALELTRRMRRPLLFDYVHATRYRDNKHGGKIEWRQFPDRDRLGGQILLIDDIFDEGYTMRAVKERLLDEGAASVLTVALAVKEHARGLPRDWVDDHALSVPDLYVFGCGMDLHGYWRQLDEIWAVPA